MNKDYTNDPRAKRVTTRRRIGGQYQILYHLRLAGWLYQDFMARGNPWRFQGNLDSGIPIGWSITKMDFPTKRDAMEHITASILWAEDNFLKQKARRKEQSA